MTKSLEAIIIKRYDNNPVFYYKAHHAGLTRWHLKQKNYLLWELLNERRQLNEIPTAKSDFGKNALDFYKKHYKGLSPFQLRKIDPGLYNRLRRDELLNLLPRRNKNDVQRERSRYGVDALAYYKKHFRGYSPGDLEQVQPGLYERLLNDGLIKYLPRLRKSRS